jgi:hypothetical protein
MAKSGFAEIGEYNPRQECTFKKRTDKDGNTLKEHVGTDGTSECSLEAKYGAIDPFASMGYLTTVCRNHMEVPKKLMTGMAELHRAFPEDGEKLSDEKTRVDRQVERQRIDDPEVERQRKLREQWDNDRSQSKDTGNNQGTLDFDISELF